MFGTGVGIHRANSYFGLRLLFNSIEDSLSKSLSIFNSQRFLLYGDGGLVIKSGSSMKSDSDFGLGGGLGYSVNVGNAGYIDIVPSFNIIFQEVVNRTWLDFHLAYRFRL